MSKNRWEGKSFIAFGTSITWNCASFDGGYLEVMKERNGFASYLNAGVSGAALANDTANGMGINTKIRTTSVEKYDLVMIECGTNDFKLNVKLGEIRKVKTEEFDTKTFYGALQDGIEYILKQYPHKRIMLIADCQRDHDGYDVYYTNPAGNKLMDYIDAIHEIGTLYGLPVCDWYRNGGINAWTLGVYTYDGLHPNKDGYVALGNVAAACVEKMY